MRLLNFCCFVQGEDGWLVKEQELPLVQSGWYNIRCWDIHPLYMLGMVRQQFKELEKECFLIIYKGYVGPRL